MRQYLKTCLSVLYLCGLTLLLRAQSSDDDTPELGRSRPEYFEYIIGDNDSFTLKLKLIGEPKNENHEIGGKCYSIPTPIVPISLTIKEKLENEVFVEYEFVDYEYEWEINNKPDHFDLVGKTEQSCTFTVTSAFKLKPLSGSVKVTPKVKKTSTGIIEKLAPAIVTFDFDPWGNISADYNNDATINSSSHFHPGKSDFDDLLRDKFDNTSVKIAILNDDDADGDGKPDYMDGKKCCEKPVLSENFVELQCLTSASNLDEHYFSITHGGVVDYTGSASPGTSLENPTTYSPTGSFRVWRKSDSMLLESGKVYKQISPGGFQLHLEALQPGAYTVEIYSANAADEILGKSKKITVKGIPAKILFDIDRNESIDENDKNLLYYGKGFHCWVEDLTFWEKIWNNIPFIKSAQKIQDDYPNDVTASSADIVQSFQKNSQLFNAGKITNVNFGQNVASDIAPNASSQVKTAIAQEAQETLQNVLEPTPLGPTKASRGIIAYGGCSSAPEPTVLGKLVDVFPIYFDVAQLGLEDNLRDATYKLETEEITLKWILPDNLYDGEILKYHVDTSIKTLADTSKCIYEADFISTDAFSEFLKPYVINRYQARRIALFKVANASKGLVKLTVMTPSGSTLFTVRSYISASNVLDMTKPVNIRESTTSLNPNEALAEPLNYPKELNNKKVFVFAHGLMTGFGSGDPSSFFKQIFKSLYWSGSNALFCTVEWDSDQGTVNYHSNVYNALISSDSFKKTVESIASGKEVYVMGHSLGNMLISNAVFHKGMNVKKYFAVNAAVPAESYGAVIDEQNKEDNQFIGNYYPAKAGHNISHYMIENSWINGCKDSTLVNISNTSFHHPRSWASYYHLLCQDDRSKLSWVNFFGNDSSKMINYYAPTDEIFDLTDNPNLLTQGIDCSWQKQELFKGTTGAGSWLVRGSKGAGWGKKWDIVMDPSLWPPWIEISVLRYTTEQTHDTELLTDSMLRVKPAFSLDGENDVLDSTLTEKQIYKLLSEGIPSLTPATGRVPIQGFTNKSILDDLIKDTNIEFWPQKENNRGKVKNLWKHSDIRDLPYFFTQPFYKDLVKDGDLKSKE